MNVGYWLNNASTFLQSRGITTARLDCLVLLEDTLKHEKAWILAHPEYELSDAAVRHLQNLLSRRSKHEPLAYIRGHSEFYGRRFAVSPAVLVPRPESEAMIDMLKGLEVFAPAHGPLSPHTGSPDALDTHSTNTHKTAPKRLKIADIGTGSGALGITARLELPRAEVTLVELDAAAIKVAQFNVDKLTTHILVLQSDLLMQTPQDYDILLCNLPYVPDDYEVNRAAKHEPPLALFAGTDGLDLYRQLFSQVNNIEKRPLFILTESMPEQHAALSIIASSAGYDLAKTSDFIQLFELSGPK